MTVRELIAVLATADPDASVCLEWDNFCDATNAVTVVQASYNDDEYKDVFLTIVQANMLPAVAQEWHWEKYEVLHDGDAP